MTSSNSLSGSAIKVEGAQMKVKNVVNKPTLSIGMLKKNISHLSLKHHVNTGSSENYMNAKSST